MANIQQNKLLIGLECSTISEKYQVLKNGYDFIGINVLNKTWKNHSLKKYIGLSDKDVNVHVHDISDILTFALSNIQLDLYDEQIEKSIKILYDEVQYVSYIGISHFVLPLFTQKTSIPQYARIINHLFSLSTYIQFYIFFSMNDLTDPLELWDIWNTIRILCGYNNRLLLAFEIGNKLPELTTIAHWFAEPIGLLIIHSSIFVSNSDGDLVLPQDHQTFYTKIAKFKPNVLLRISDDISLSNDFSVYYQYLRHLENISPITAIERFANGYQDYLQIPLQPLADNLESITYEVFEKDHVKYDQYELSIRLALMDRSKLNEPIYIAIVGAGRGPLISRSLKAAESADRKIVIYAIEKNPNAFITLEHRNKYEWKNSIQLVQIDMRLWKPPVLIDIIVSELLGSFGDNELSPECLDGVQKFLNPKGGIFIPSSYTTYITPVMAPKIYGNILQMKNDASFEMFYSIWLHSIHYLAKNNENMFQKLWNFSHPNPNYYDDNSNLHNTRKSKNTFNISSRGMLHGFAGYFEAVLYDNIKLSTLPNIIDEKLKDMVSWFPAFFPLKTPLYIPSGSHIDLYFWRQTDSKKVWYEWLTEVYMTSSNTQNDQHLYQTNPIKIGMTGIHNYNASFFSIGLS
ncbi:hypothetical protein T552_01456 [Pneumocystis carinii B80]|uniref:Protein arginine N-methyltransferase n=1 Tax=Pneumocystis carinii (strain B80) TaxID=1408658 RepID=A0A0W4ZKE5_PNEC8|nr:hypothetical protein T552_01456 [Pneumocystis carinii B80]KTW28827.1 hypothetical protein T552_01456 [Pneumocystis carinii B80]